MHFGVSMFLTDYSTPAVELARALEERGFESMWAPEHSHIPLSRRTPFPGGGELPKPYSEVMDPFVVLSAAAAVTKTLKLGTGVCLVVQRDPIQTAKWSPRSTKCRAGGSSSELVEAGMPKKSRTTAPHSKPASS
jgi:alkanesulfonate monooxygenase SsuD/methylene tetrahydromethanopterin reductase-like flavin-dependent oxidoreductase (luciferase family)